MTISLILGSVRLDLLELQCGQFISRAVFIASDLTFFENRELDGAVGVVVMLLHAVVFGFLEGRPKRLDIFKNNFLVYACKIMGHTLIKLIITSIAYAKHRFLNSWLYYFFFRSLVGKF